MRVQGRLAEWNYERGFGFVIQNDTRDRAFLHISGLKGREKRPMVGSLITYELTKDNRGRLQARNAQLVASERKPRPVSFGAIAAFLPHLVAVIAVAYVGYVRLANPNSTISSSVYKIVVARDALRVNPEFKCEPKKNFCSNMSSCAEALFHQERCGVPDMDGDRDGIPCEQQWCN